MGSVYRGWLSIPREETNGTCVFFASLRETSGAQNGRYDTNMDVAARNRLAELMYEVKEKVPDGTFLEFMNILGKKENKPDFKDVQFVKLTYFHHQYLEPYRFLDDSECIGYDCTFKAHRIDRTLQTQILELTDEDQGTMEMDLFHSRMFYKKFDTIAEGIHKQNTWCFVHQGNPVIKGKKRIAVTWIYSTEQ